MSIIADFVARLSLISDKESFEGGTRLIEAMKSQVEWAVGREAINGIREMVMGVVELGEKLRNTAQMTGQSVEGLQFFGYAASLNGSSAEEMSFAVGHLSRSLTEATTKGGAAGQAFHKLGININSKDFKANSTDEKLQLIADKFAKLKDGPEKAALAMQLFGRSGKQLIPTLNDLGKNGDELRKEFQELGGGLTTDQAGDLKEFGDEVKKTEFSLGALKNQIVVKLLPTLKGMLDGFMEWIKVNRQVVVSITEGIIEGLELVFKALGYIAQGLAAGFEYLSQHRDLMIAIIVGLGAIITAFSIQAAIDWVLAFWPLILVGVLVAGVILVIKKLWEYVRGGEGTFEEFGEAAMASLEELKDWFVSIPDKIESAFSDAWEAIKSGAKAAFEWIVNLPVIKQLIEVYNWATSPTSKEGQQAITTGESGMSSYLSGGSFAQAQKDYLASQTTDSSPVTITGDTHITVTGGPDVSTPELADMVKDHIDSAYKTKMQNAFDAIKGGHR